MSKKNKKMKKGIKKKVKIVLGIVIILIAMIIIVKSLTILMDKSSSTDGQNVITKGTNQEELEVVEEEPVETGEVITQKEDASYEKWLAAEMIIGISLQYSEYEFTGIYLASETEISNYFESKGAYIVFKEGGNEKAIHSQPLEKERTEAGTKDLYTEELGLATFDEVAVSSINMDECQKVEMDELSKLLSQSVLVSVYEH